METCILFSHDSHNERSLFMLSLEEFMENVNKIAKEKGQQPVTADNQFLRLAYDGYCRSAEAGRSAATPSEQLTRILRRKADFPVIGKEKLRDEVLEKLVQTGRFLDKQEMYTGPFDQAQPNVQLNAAVYLLRSMIEQVELVPWFGYRMVPNDKGRSTWEISYWLMDPDSAEIYEPSKKLGKYYFGYPMKAESFLRNVFGIDQQHLSLLLGK